jgi:hypothetical protein
MFWKSGQGREQARKDREWRRLVRKMPRGERARAEGNERIRAYVERLREEWPGEPEGGEHAPPGIGPSLGSPG